MTRWAFFVEGTPIAQPRTHDAGGGRRFVPKDHPVHGWRQRVQVAALACRPRPKPTAGPVSITASFWIPRPKSHFRRGSPCRPADLLDDAPAHHTRTLDGDNLEKAVWDALKGVCWRDDAQIVAWGGAKHWTPQIRHAPRQRGPGVYVEVAHLETT